ncbi:reductase [Immersiella caudata]|uniref:Reductase n=1 Tax=Immersiella caudata TaxID=314043 RepID=A0AA39WZF7_9PEZI|nr:reductase [Immersiella caudata]
MHILILGGTSFVGRHIAITAVTRSHKVTLLNRGTHPAPEGTTSLVGDRLDALHGLDALEGLTFDAVLDTWSGDPAAVVRSATALQSRTEHYAYISSLSVYEVDPSAGGEGGALWDESAPLFDVTAPDARKSEYQFDKRSAEIAIEGQGFPKALLIRPGVILGPHEAAFIERGRLTWWLSRLSRGGRTPAPGPDTMGLQFVDARDLAEFVVRGFEKGLTGVYNTVSEVDRVTMGDVLVNGNEVTGNRAELVWKTPREILDAGVQPWSELPLWLDPESPSYLTVYQWDVTKAEAGGLKCRSAKETIQDTWAWMEEGELKPVPAPEGTKGLLGLPLEKEIKLLVQPGLMK